MYRTICLVLCSCSSTRKSARYQPTPEAQAALMQADPYSDSICYSLPYTDPVCTGVANAERAASVAPQNRKPQHTAVSHLSSKILSQSAFIKPVSLRSSSHTVAPHPRLDAILGLLAITVVALLFLWLYLSYPAQFFTILGVGAFILLSILFLYMFIALIISYIQNE